MSGGYLECLTVELCVVIVVGSLLHYMVIQGHMYDFNNTWSSATYYVGNDKRMSRKIISLCIVMCV